MFKLFITASIVVLALGSNCGDLPNKSQCNQHECGWYRGECVPCGEVEVQHRCTGLCIWDETDGSCGVAPTMAPTLAPTAPCGEQGSKEECIGQGCSWNKKMKTCKDPRPCDQVKSRKVCDKRNDCTLDDDKKCISV